MVQPLRVGIVGASAQRGWARVAHVPAIHALKDFTLSAVASGSQAKADAAAEAFGARLAFGNAEDLVNSSEVDVVSVSVKVPDHRSLVLAACRAGKHVYCEWPLGRSARETAEMEEAARTAGVKTVIGLQLRGSPSFREAARLLRAGEIGRLLSVRAETATAAFGPDIEAAMEFAEDASNGVTLLTIQGAHTLDGSLGAIGQEARLRMVSTTQYPTVRLENGEQRRRSIPDHVLIQGRSETGVALSVEVAGGRPQDTRSTVRFIGESGDILLAGIAPRGFQSARLRLFVRDEEYPVDEGELSNLPEEAVNVAGLYQLLRDDIRNGSSNAPGFHHARQLADLLEALRADDVPSLVAPPLGLNAL